MGGRRRRVQGQTQGPRCRVELPKSAKPILFEMWKGYYGGGLLQLFGGDEWAENSATLKGCLGNRFVDMRQCTPFKKTFRSVGAMMEAAADADGSCCCSRRLRRVSSMPLSAQVL